MRILLLLLLCSTTSFTQEIPLDSINGYMKNIFKKIDTFPISIVGYENDNQEVSMLLKFRPKITSYAIALDSNQQKELLAGLKKYVEWRKIAMENNVTNHEDISTIPVQSVYQSSLNETVSNGTMTLTFSSTNTKTHLLYMHVNKLESQNSGLNAAPSEFYIDFLGVLTLEKLLTSDFSKKIDEALKKQKNTKDLFQ